MSPPLKQPARIFSDWTPSYAIRVTKQDSNAYGLLEYGPFDAISDPTTYSPAHFQPGRTQCVYVDGRHILSGAQYVVVAENISETEHDTPRRAGIPQVTGVEVNGIDTQRAPRTIRLFSRIRRTRTPRLFDAELSATGLSIVRRVAKLLQSFRGRLQLQYACSV